MTTIILFALAGAGLITSLIKSKEKSKQAVKAVKNLGKNMVGEVLGVMALVGLLLAIFPPETIKQLLGGNNKMLSTFFGAIIGTITIIPGFVAFPLSKSLVQSGAHLMAIAAFITTLTMVGLATLPIEIRHFGKKFALYRNILSFFAAIAVALLMGVLL